MRQKSPKYGAGFTLIEVLMTGILMAIVLPVIMEGISTAAAAATDARHRSEATGLAQAKLSELMVTPGLVNGQISGDFSTDWPDYQWQATVQPWQNDPNTSGLLQEIDLTVTWTISGRQNHVTLSTLFYPSTTAQL